MKLKNLISDQFIALVLKTALLLCRSDSGVVNVYDEKYLHQSQPKPLKAIMNLTTSVNKALFNSTRYVCP